MKSLVVVSFAAALLLAAACGDGGGPGAPATEPLFNFEEGMSLTAQFIRV